MFGLGPWELAIIAVILLLLFGAKKIPEIGKGVGGAVREFRNIKKEINGSSGDSEKTDEEAADKKESAPGYIEGKIKDKMLNNVPGARKAMEINDKIKKVKEVVK